MKEGSKMKSKCYNCLKFHEGVSPKCLTYEYHIWCKDHYPRFLDVFYGETEECGWYEPYQLSFEDVLKNINKEK